MNINGVNEIDIPSIEDIQQTLVNINDKPPEFLHSTEWLGALEVFDVFVIQVYQRNYHSHWMLLMQICSIFRSSM